MIENSLTAQV